MPENTTTNFLKNNIIAIICLVITVSGVLINVGMNAKQISDLKTDVVEMKTFGTPFGQKTAALVFQLEKEFIVARNDTKEKIRELEKNNKEYSEKTNEKLDTLNRQMAVVVSWIEEQKKYPR